MFFIQKLCWPKNFFDTDFFEPNYFFDFMFGEQTYKPRSSLGELVFKNPELSTLIKKVPFWKKLFVGLIRQITIYFLDSSGK